MNTIKLENGNCLDYIKKLPDTSVDLIFADPPYNLSSQVYIKENGKPDLKKAKDFMDKWSGLDGEFLEEFYKECLRVLKYGGHCLLFGIDRQLFMFEYYANLSGFTQKQSLYWYFCSNFPKASDLSKMIDKNAGAEREVVGKVEPFGREGRTKMGHQGYTPSLGREEVMFNNTESLLKTITTPSTPLAKKYEGIKYSVAPLKQTNETIMVFQKPYKTGSCLHDVLAMENGDDTITCGGVDIEGNRVGTEGGRNNGSKAKEDGYSSNPNGTYGKFKPTEKQDYGGRFPSQTYIDRRASEVIDVQSGVSKSGNGGIGTGSGNKNKVYGQATSIITSCYQDSGGASRILHKCDFESGDYDLYHYCPKVSKAERNEGLEGFEDKLSGNTAAKLRCKICGYVNQHSLEGRNICTCTEPDFEKAENKTKNNHPTVKPKALLSKILKLFKTPNNQVLLDPFMGSGSMGISALETGFDFIGYELDQEYFKIAEARIANAQSKADERLL
jgi:site-specific DNA-methyltransferase (adenine-specific)